MPTLKLHYFSIVGLGEASRLIFTVGGVPFEDVHYTREQWIAVKPTMPFGQMPVLEVDGKLLAQSGAIERCAARLAGLMPSDPWDAAQADQAVFVVKDIADTITPTRSIPEGPERTAARQALVKDVFPVRFGQLGALLDKAGGQYVAGGALSWADITIFVWLSSLTSGLLDGIPTDVLDAYPTVKAYRNHIASVPAIKAYYEKNTDGVRVAFRPDDAKAAAAV